MEVKLDVKKRNIFGKKTKQLLINGLIPAEVYGRGIDNVHLSAPLKDFVSALKEAGESSIIYIDIEGDRRPVLIHNVQRHPVTDQIISVDFYQVRLDEEVKAAVPIELVGEAPAVKEKEAVLLQVMRELEVEALPTKIPRSVSVDVSSLIDIGQAILVKDLKIDRKDVKILAAPEAVVVKAQARITEEEEKSMEEAGASVAEVKVEGEKKKEQEEEKVIEEEKKSE